MLGGKNLAQFFDHTLLRADAQQREVEVLCAEAIEFGFFSVCVQPYYAEFAASKLSDSPVKVCSVVGFPLGQNTTEVKVFETKQLLDMGVEEIDMVMNLAAFKAGENHYVVDDIAAVREACEKNCLKVIIETCLLNPDEIAHASQLVVEGGGTFVKTSTGFSSGGARLEDIKIISQIVGDNAKIKASGGIRDLKFATELIENGVHRLGASASVNIMKEANS